MTELDPSMVTAGRRWRRTGNNEPVQVLDAAFATGLSARVGRRMDRRQALASHDERPRLMRSTMGSFVSRSG